MGDLGDGIVPRDFVRHAIAIGDTSEAVRRARSFAARVPGSAMRAILGDAELAHGDRAQRVPPMRDRRVSGVLAAHCAAAAGRRGRRERA